MRFSLENIASKPLDAIYTNDSKIRFQPGLSSELQPHLPNCLLGYLLRNLKGISESTSLNPDIWSFSPNLIFVHCSLSQWLVLSTKKKASSHPWHIPKNLPFAISCQSPTPVTLFPHYLLNSSNSPHSPLLRIALHKSRDSHSYKPQREQWSLLELSRLWPCHPYHPTVCHRGVLPDYCNVFSVSVPALLNLHFILQTNFKTQI